MNPSFTTPLAVDTVSALDFTKGDGLLPAIVQDAQTRRVLMLGYMNREAVERTLADGRVWFFSRTRNRLWMKGETSENYLEVAAIGVDCDHDTLLVQANPVGAVCHTGADTCFGEENLPYGLFFSRLQGIVRERAGQHPDDSYTARLLAKGVGKVAQKVGEEAVEVVIDAVGGNRERMTEEAADLLFHLSVLFQATGVSLSEVEQVLYQRHILKK